MLRKTLCTKLVIFTRMYVYRNIAEHSRNQYCYLKQSIIHYGCLYSCHIHPVCKLHLVCAILYCELSGSTMIFPHYPHERYDFSGRGSMNIKYLLIFYITSVWNISHSKKNSRMYVFLFPMMSLEFFIDIILPAALWPWGLKKWVPGVFPGGKGGRCVGLTTLPPSCADCLEIWESQPPGTLRACPGL
jgi:hypothetical protein